MLICPICKKPFTPKNEKHTFCSNKCRCKNYRLKKKKIKSNNNDDISFKFITDFLIKRENLDEQNRAGIR